MAALIRWGQRAHRSGSGHSASATFDPAPGPARVTVTVYSFIVVPSPAVTVTVIGVATPSSEIDRAPRVRQAMTVALVIRFAVAVHRNLDFNGVPHIWPCTHT